MRTIPAGAGESGNPSRALWFSTAAFMACLAVWMISPPGLSGAQFGLSLGMSLLTGSLAWRMGAWRHSCAGRAAVAPRPRRPGEF